MNVSYTKSSSNVKAPRALSVPTFNLSGYDMSFLNQKIIPEKQKLTYHMIQYEKNRAKAISDKENIDMI